MPQSIENDANLAYNNPYMHSSITHIHAGVPARRIHTVRDLCRAKPIPSLRNTRPSRNHLRTLEHHTPFHYEDVGTLLPTEAAPKWSSV